MKKDKESYLGTPSQIDRYYKPAANRYQKMQYRRCGKSGLLLPAITLGLWQNFGDEVPYEQARALLLKAFDVGITHFDLGNNYGRPPGSAEKTLGRVLHEDLAHYRDEVIITTKAGYDMWPGPYGEWGSRKYLFASINQSLQRLGLDYVDIFYSHRFDPATPLEETMHALADIVAQGKALYVGVSSYGVKETQQAARILKERNVPFIVHQPSYSLFTRWIEKGLLTELEQLGLGCVSFTALEQGLLTNKYINNANTPKDARMYAPGSLLKPAVLTPDMQRRLKGLANIAEKRGQSLAQMAIAWVLQRVTSTVVGARTIEQLEHNIGALHNLTFTENELAAINEYAEDLGITLWPPNC